MGRLLAIAAALTIGCGSDDGADRSGEAAAAVSLDEDPAGRAVVATVNGRPVYDDCVARQAAAHQLDRRAALAECVDFELLAQAAEARGYAAAPEVRDVRTTETARVYLERAFMDRFDGPEDVPEAHARIAYDQMRKPEYFREREWRSTQYARFPVPPLSPRGGPFDLVARLLAEVAYAQMKDRRWDEAEFRRETQAIAGNYPVVYERRPFRFSRRGPIELPYLEATFEIDEPGQISPPVRTERGWDIILLLEILPPIDRPFEQVEAEIKEKIFERSREEVFKQWLAETVPLDDAEIDTAWLERLARADQSDALLPAGGRR
jgi:hypothetical protein